jgi:hypothetical protein
MIPEGAGPFARSRPSFYMGAMTGRPCKPDADLKKLWQLLLPGTSFPACGVPEKSAAAADDPAAINAGRQSGPKRHSAT